MLPLKAYAPLPHPTFDDATMKALAERGYAWADGEVEGVAFRWLSPRRWTLVGRLPPASDDGFVPAMGFVNEKLGARAGLRYAGPSWEFDPGDFLDVADARPFREANAYVLGETVVAERAGKNDDTIMMAAAYRLGRHFFMITSEAPAQHAPELLEPLSVLNSGLRIRASGTPIGPENAHDLKGLSLRVRCSDGTEVTGEPGGATLNTAYREHRSEVRLRIERSPFKSAEALAREEKAVAEAPCPLRHESIRYASLKGIAVSSGEVLVENIDTEDGRELALVAAPLAGDRGLVIRALYPGPTISKTGWLAARYALARLLKSAELLEA
jgi:hypothetical protein